MTEVQTAITALLRTRHGLAATDTNDFNILDQAQLLATASSISGTLTLLLGGIASISLIVGGIGIMNIMLVSVRERTREIGIRKAVGARGRDILAQFLIEALTLSVLGGIIGIAVGPRGLRRSSRASAASPSPSAPQRSQSPCCSASRSASCSASGPHARRPGSTRSPPSATNRRPHVTTPPFDPGPPSRSPSSSPTEPVPAFPPAAMPAFQPAEPEPAVRMAHLEPGRRPEALVGRLIEDPQPRPRSRRRRRGRRRRLRRRAGHGACDRRGRGHHGPERGGHRRQRVPEPQLRPQRPRQQRTSRWFHGSRRVRWRRRRAS